MGRPPFDLDQRPSAASVTITGPEAARDSVNVLFGHFRSGFGHQGMAKVSVSRQMFGDILSLITGLRAPLAAA